MSAEIADTDGPERPKRNPQATTAAAQGSMVPLGWKPTLAKPVPVIRCVAIKRDGVRCGRWSLRGSDKCIKHLKGSLNFPSVTAHREAVLESARMRLLDDSELAIDTIEALMEPGTAEAIRLKAATEVLDRAGIRGGVDINITTDDNRESPADQIAKRMSTLRERQLERDRKAQLAISMDEEDDGDPEIIISTVTYEEDTLF